MKSLAGRVLLVLLVVGAAVALWFVATRQTSPPDAGTGGAPAQSTTPPFSLDGRLVLEPSAPGEPTLGIIRLFDIRARNGFSQGGNAVVVSRAAIDAGIALEIEQAGGDPAPGAKPVVLRAPADGSHQVQADTTLEMLVDLTNLPPAGSRVRVSLPIGSLVAVTEWVEVPATPANAVDALAARARVQRAKGDAALAATADQLVAQAPTDARGYYYRGLALEQSGDRAGAIAAYEAALERIPAGGQEPPVAIYRRLARLRAQ